MRPGRMTVLGLILVLVLTGCDGRIPVATIPGTVSSPGAATRYSKIMIIAEENHGYGQIVGSPDAPYINELAHIYGTATAMNAGYPPGCPSLAAYILITSGSTTGICDDKDPASHLITGPNIFDQVVTSGRQWREYADGATTPCQGVNGGDGRFLVRHTPPPYYVTERERCARWDLPLGSTTGGALHDDLVAGTLPAYSFVSPDACHDMHGADVCRTGLLAAGDTWLRDWMPVVLAGADYRAGRLVVIVTWDEGTRDDNHIATLVISPTTDHVVSDTPYTHCSTLRLAEEVLGLPLLRCAITSTSMVPEFGL